MKKISLMLIFDCVFKFILLFSLNIIWTLYFIRITWLSVICAIILPIIEILIGKYFLFRRNKKTAPKLQEQQHIEDVNNAFIFMAQKKVLNFFNKLFSSTHDTKIKHDYIIIGQETPIIIYPCFKLNKLNSDEIIKMYNSITEKNIKRILILCNSYETNIVQVLNNFKTQVIILDKVKIYYNFLKPKSTFPEINSNTPTKNKLKFKEIIQIAFNKKKTKSYFLSAFFILFSSIFVSYKIYYLIFASILFIFAILSRFNFSYVKPEQDYLA